MGIPLLIVYNHARGISGRHEGQHISILPVLPMPSFAVIGASRGIGLEYVRQLVSRSLVQRDMSFANV